MNAQYYSYIFVCTCLFGVSGIPLLTTAQTIVTSDGTTGSLVNGLENTPCTGGTCRITGGTEVGANVFHSLTDFSLSSGDEAQFESGGIDVIFTRVTGGAVSSIDGLISTTSEGTDLFLLNPSGILFGPDASLNIGGSFIASSAEQIVFDNGATFDATEASLPNALLTINVPIGLQYGANPGDILVEGNGNNLALDPDTFSVDRSNRPVGLQVDSGQTLALIGGNITLTGGNVTAESGQIAVGAVGDNSLVDVSPSALGWEFQYDDVSQFQDIKLSQAASLDISGTGGGQMDVQGQRLVLRGGSVLLANTTGSDDGANISIDAADRLAIRGFSETLPSGIFNDVVPGATGSSGTLAIATDTLRLAEGGQISATTFGEGNSGGLTIDARRLSLSGTPTSFIFANTGFTSTGQGGDAIINADQIELTNGSQIITSAFGAGQAGDLKVTAQSIVGSGIDPSDVTGSGLVSLGLFGQGGDIVVDTESLSLDTGAFISTGTLATANAGDVVIEADRISLSGTPPDDLVSDSFVSSSIAATVNAEAPGNGGSLTITTGSLDVSDGSQVFSSTFGLGNAGPIDIEANTINIIGTTTDQLTPSGIFAQAEVGSTGTGSSIHLQVGDLVIQDGGQVGVGTFGDGDAGELVIEADTITLAGSAAGSRSGLFANAIAGTGNGGDLLVIADRLVIQDGAAVSASNFQSQGILEPGQGAAGNITIRVPIIDLDNGGRILADTAVGDQGNLTLDNDILVLRDGSQISTNAGSADGGNIEIATVAIASFDNSDISANALEGFGGRVIVTADGIFGTTFRPQLTPRSDITASSALGASFSGEVVINTPDVDPSRGLVELPETVVDASEQIRVACESIDANTLTVEGPGGLPQMPNQLLTSDSIWLDLRSVEDLVNNGEQSRLQHSGFAAGNIEAESAAHSSTNIPDIPLSGFNVFHPREEAQEWWVNNQGNVVLGSTVRKISLQQEIECNKLQDMTTLL